ncbi:hypothetical protein KM043_018847, partial [Ampulex compressa]
MLRPQGPNKKRAGSTTAAARNRPDLMLLCNDGASKGLVSDTRTANRSDTSSDGPKRTPWGLVSDTRLANQSDTSSDCPEYKSKGLVSDTSTGKPA